MRVLFAVALLSLMSTAASASYDPKLALELITMSQVSFAPLSEI